MRHKYTIEISHSDGDKEELYGVYISKEDAYREMCVLASAEAYKQNEAFVEDKTCTVYYDAFNKRIDLCYGVGQSWRYYRVVSF